MRTIQVHLDDTLTKDQLNALKKTLMSIPHIKEINMSPQDPHDFLVDFEETHNTPMAVISELHHQGLHPDIISA